MPKRAAQKEAAVTLGGRQFEIQRPNIKRSREWREQFGEPVRTIASILQHAEEIELNSVGDVAGLLQQVGPLLLGSVDILIEAVFAYSEVLEAEREWIEENADDEEALAALWEIVKLAYPFGSILDVVTRGQAMVSTSKSSPAPNGGSTRRRSARSSSK